MVVQFGSLAPVVPEQFGSGDPQVAWAIDGRPYVIDWDSFDAQAPGGFGTLTDALVHPKGPAGKAKARIKQGHVVTGVRRNNDIVYQGTILEPPRFLPDGSALISAYGPRSVAERYSDRILYQSADPTLWSQMHEQPFHVTASDVLINLISKGDSLGWKLDAIAHTTGQLNGYAIYTGAQRLNRIAFTLRKTADAGNFEMHVQTAADFGTYTDLAGSPFNLGAATPDGTTKNYTTGFGANDNTAIIFVRATANSTPGSWRGFLDDLRISAVTQSDTFTAGQVAADVASRMPYAAGRIEGGLNILPLDWNGNASDLLDLVADMSDQYWFVDADPTGAQYGRLNFRAWGRRVWTVRLDRDAVNHEGLRCAPVYDGITTFWESPGGVPRHTRSRATDFGFADPLPGLQYDYPDPVTLADRQRNDVLARSVNQYALRYLTTLRVQGGVTVTQLPRATHPFAIQPGDLIKLQGFDPVLPPQRIVACTYNSVGTVDVSLGFDQSLDGIIERVALHKHRPWMKHQGYAKTGR